MHVLAAHQAVVLRVDGFDRDVREQALDTVQFEAHLRSEQDDGRVGRLLLDLGDRVGVDLHVDTVLDGGFAHLLDEHGGGHSLVAAKDDMHDGFLSWGAALRPRC